MTNSKTDTNMNKYFFRASASDFKKIPGSPIAYWVSEHTREVFRRGEALSSVSKPRVGMRTGDNERFLRQWHEVSLTAFSWTSASASEASESGKKWFPFVKGGDFRKWFGNVDQVVNWAEDGFEIKKETLAKYPQLSWDNLGWKISNEAYYFSPAITWSAVSSSCFGVRFVNAGNIFGTGGSCIFPDSSKYELLGALLCSKLGHYFITIENPTLNINIEDVAAIPILGELPKDGVRIAKSCCATSRADWYSYETSWHFTSLPLLNPDYRQPTLKATYKKLRTHWREMTLEMRRLEEENNRIFIEAYGLQEELTPDVPWDEITLTCNPYYRYGKKADETTPDSNGSESKNNNTTHSSLPTSHWPLATHHFPLDPDLETRLLQDTIKELISYAVGCMFGRYSLDKPGLILANQGETLADFVRKVCSEEWVVDSEGENNGDRSQFQRVDSLAEGDGLSGVGVSGNQAVSEGGSLRTDQPDQAIGGIHSIQHSRRSSQKVDSRISEFLVDCQRFKLSFRT